MKSGIIYAQWTAPSRLNVFLNQNETIFFQVKFSSEPPEGV